MHALVCDSHTFSYDANSQGCKIEQQTTIDPSECTVLAAFLEVLLVIYAQLCTHKLHPTMICFP